MRPILYLKTQCFAAGFLALNKNFGRKLKRMYFLNKTLKMLFWGHILVFFFYFMSTKTFRVVNVLFIHQPTSVHRNIFRKQLCNRQIHFRQTILRRETK